MRFVLFLFCLAQFLSHSLTAKASPIQEYEAFDSNENGDRVVRLQYSGRQAKNLFEKLAVPTKVYDDLCIRALPTNAACTFERHSVKETDDKAVSCVRAHRVRPNSDAYTCAVYVRYRSSNYENKK